MRILFLTLSLLLGVNAVYAEGSCKKCEKVREWHKNHPSKYTFYEDYKEAVENGEVDPEEESAEGALKDKQDEITE